MFTRDATTEILTEGISSYKSAITIPNIFSDRSGDPFRNLLIQEPLAFNVGGYKIVKTAVSTTYIPDYTIEKTQYDHLLSDCIRTADKLLRIISSSSPIAMLENLHHEIWRKITYRESQYAHSIVGPLLYKEGVCEGISKMVKFICDRAGIECVVVYGTINGNEPHAWNQLKIDGDWYNADFTADLTASSKDYELMDFFLASDFLISADHTFEMTTRGCNRNDLNIHGNRRLIGKAAVIEEIRRQKNAGEKEIILWIKDAPHHRVAIETIINNEFDCDPRYIYYHQTEFYHIFMK